MLCRPIGDDVILGVINMDGKEEELLEEPEEDGTPLAKLRRCRSSNDPTPKIN
jgi:hypothetical protein